MPSVPGAWTSSTINGRTVLECDTTVTSSDNDAYTLKTPAGKLDTTRPWILMVNTGGVTIDNQALAVDIWAGHADGFVMSGNDGTVAVTTGSGYEVLSAVIDDVKSVGLAVIVNPNYNGALVQTALSGPVEGICNPGKAPYYIINCDGQGTFSGSVTCHYVIIQ